MPKYRYRPWTGAGSSATRAFGIGEIVAVEGGAVGQITRAEDCRGGRVVGGLVSFGEYVSEAPVPNRGRSSASALQTSSARR
jgi:hypothetical protein